jgi:transposase InsO family protein
MKELTEIPERELIKWTGVSSSKYYDWRKRVGIDNHHNGRIPKSNWLLDWEKEAIKEYARKHLGEGYRRLTYMMLDRDIVAVSPSSVYRVLRKAGMLNKWNRVKSKSKGHGFDQPHKPHVHWHIDIKYVNFRGTFLFLISIIDGYSRYIVHHELRTNMQEHDVEVTVQRALEKIPGVKPRIISDNGKQFISKDFTEYLRLVGLQHIRTSFNYPQSNGKIERFHRTIHEECLQKSSLIDIDDARKQIFKYIEFYNKKRLHSALNYLTPEDYLLGRVDERLKEREQKLEDAAKNRYNVRKAG